MYGLGLGINYTVARYWLGYYFKNVYEDRNNGDKFIGTGVKLGIGFQVNSSLRCNFELLYSAIKKVDYGSGEAEFTGYNISSAHVSVSIPISL